MRKAALAYFLILTPCSLRAQDKKGDWRALYGLHSGEKIEVVESGMKEACRYFLYGHRGSDSVARRLKRHGIPKENVVRVTVLDKGHRLRNALIFGAAGAGGGAGIGAAVSRCSSSNAFCDVGRGVAVGLGGLVGLAGGAAIGAAVPSHPTLYRAAPKPNTPH